MAITLSILVCTVPQRKFFFQRLADRLQPQIDKFKDRVECKADPRPRGFKMPDGRKGTIGDKRNALLREAVGEYVCFVDDDDLVSGDYVEVILEAISMNPDADSVGLIGVQQVDGKGPLYPFAHSIKYDGWFEENGWRYRCPNHLNAVKREIALKVGFPPLDHGEDREYSMGIKDLIKTEAPVNQTIYLYDFRTTKTEFPLPL
jgi:glycosyltransferase involved in cell wall biosynthesis